MKNGEERRGETRRGEERRGEEDKTRGKDRIGGGKKGRLVRYPNHGRGIYEI